MNKNNDLQIQPLISAKPSKDLIKKCHNWATEFLKGSYYSQLGDYHKIHYDQKRGKITEWFIYHLLKNRGLKPTKPSMAIKWENGLGRFPPDLELPEQNVIIEVKAESYRSWTFHKDHKFTKPQTYWGALTSFQNAECHLWALIDLYEVNFRPPNNPKQRHKKKCIYRADLENYKNLLDLE